MGRLHRAPGRDTRRLLSLCLLVVTLLSSCGSSDAKRAPSGDGPSAPSASAQMVCSREAAADVSGTIGVVPTEITTPTWTDRVFACTYRYGKASIPLAVKELGSAKETVAYFTAREKDLDGRATPLGDDSFQAPDGTVVLRKDTKVLTVDATHLPADFGSPVRPRASIVLSVAAALLSCWTGD